MGDRTLNFNIKSPVGHIFYVALPAKTFSRVSSLSEQGLREQRSSTGQTVNDRLPSVESPLDQAGSSHRNIAPNRVIDSRTVKLTVIAEICGGAESAVVVSCGECESALHVAGMSDTLD